MNQREEAAAIRESARLTGKAQAASASDADSDNERDELPPAVKVEWKPRGKGSITGKRRVVPSLFRLCLDLLSDNFDHIESLGDVSPEVRNHLAGVLCRQLKLTTEALQLLSEPGVTELVLPDCSRIEPDQMRASLLQCRTTLKLLRLGTCGRCVGDEAVGALAGAGGVPRLETAALAGTYQLTDSGVLELLASCPRLRAIELPANSRITRKSLEAMVDTRRPIGSALTSLFLTDCIWLGPEELEPLEEMGCLERLSLSGLTKLTDEALRKVLEASGRKLRHLDISDCTALTDVSLRAIGTRCGVLESFSLGMCPLLTNVAIQELFQYRGSSADVANSKGNPAAPIPTVPTSNGTKAKGKGKRKGRAVSPQDDEDEDEDVDGIEENPSEVTSSSLLPPPVGGVDTGGSGEGHAMLKSRLTSVSLRGLVQVDDGAIMALAAACSGSLRSLDLKGVALVTDNSLVALAQFCSSALESLDLSFCRAITDDGLGHLVDSAIRLRSLRLWGCTQISERFLKGHSREELVISRY